MTKFAPLANSFFKSLTVLGILCLILNSPVFASGNPVPGRWQKVVAVEPGAGIIVYTQDGNRLECRFQSIVDESMASVERDDFRLAGNRVWVGYEDDSREGIFVSLTSDGFLIGSDMDGGRHQIKLEEINKIVLLTTKKHAQEGAIWGAMGGAIGGTLFSVLTFDDFTPSGHLLSAGAGAGLGALLGSITGAAVGSSGETIYISPDAAKNKTGN